MEYIDVQWKHHDPAYPLRLIAELNGQRLEVRKLEFFADGSVGVAWSGSASHGTALGGSPVPPLPEINSDAQFYGKVIDAAEFESLWKNHAAPVG